MRLGHGARAPRGSFGIPQDMHPDTLAKARAEAESVPAAQQQDTSSDGFEFDDSSSPETQEDEATSDASPESSADKIKTPRELLAELGVDITPDDWSDLFFRGALEKTLQIAEMPQPDGTTKPFTITVRTLTGDEYDMADELLATELQSTNMTRDGMDTRKQMWVFSFALTKINGRPICKPVVITDPKTKTETPDPRGTAKLKRKVLSQMSPVVLRMALDKYWVFVNQITLLTSDPKKNFFGKP